MRSDKHQPPANADDFLKKLKGGTPVADPAVDELLAEKDKRLLLNVPFKLHQAAVRQVNAGKSKSLHDYILKALVEKVRRDDSNA